MLTVAWAVAPPVGRKVGALALTGPAAAIVVAKRRSEPIIMRVITQ